MNIWLIIAIPLISSLIGWVTNFLAVRMIFRPYRPISILGITVQGLLPRRKAELAGRIGTTVESELISHADIRAVLDDPAFHNEVVGRIMESIQKVITQKLAANPMIGAFLSGDVMDTILSMLRSNIEKEVPAFMAGMFERMEEHIDVQALVEEKIRNFDMRKLEEIVYAIAAKEMKAIEVFGAVLGAVVGVVQVVLILFLG
ncbi:MAG: DUF445 domain-containing protein [Fibrobacterota bacterium]